MDCPECVRLKTECEIRQLTYTTATLRLRAAEINQKSQDECMALRTQVDDAKADLDLVQSEIMQHQEGHASGEAVSSEPKESVHSTLPAESPPRPAHGSSLSQSGRVAGDRYLTFGIGIFALAYLALVIWFLRMIYAL